MSLNPFDLPDIDALPDIPDIWEEDEEAPHSVDLLVECPVCHKINSISVFREDLHHFSPQGEDGVFRPLDNMYAPCPETCFEKWAES